jgi:ABC-2 type transport system ATP-binding protein
MTDSQLIIFDNVSKFYGEVLGVNRVQLRIPPGVTSLVGPNGAGKTTLMNLLTGLIRPTQGNVTVAGMPTDAPERLFRIVGYCSHFDVFPRGVTGRSFVSNWLTLHGFARVEVARLTDEAIERVGLEAAADRRIAGYSKGMRQRIRLALAISHRPTVLVLDEPLNGLDPMARADAMSLFQALGREGHHIIISSHILHEVDRISDQVILLSNGYVVAEGQIHGVRSEVTEHPMQMLVRCSEPSRLAVCLFAEPHVVEAKLQRDGHGLLVRTRDVEAFYRCVQNIVITEHLDLESVAPADDDALALYQYLIGTEA